MLVLSLGYLVAEVVDGLLTGSLALLADAGHMLSDVSALAMSLFAGWIVARPATPTRSYGYRRAEVLTALLNAAMVLVAVVLIAIEAVGRLQTPAMVDGRIVSAVAAGGLAVNTVGLLLLRGGSAVSLNLRGAWLHLASDAVGIIGVILSGAAAMWFGWAWVDPLASLIIAVLVARSGWALVRDTLAILMEYAPPGLDPVAIRDAMRQVAGVADVHDLHVWSISSNMTALSAHVGVRDEADSRPGEVRQAARGASPRSRDAVLSELHRLLHDRFGIGHVTLQLEANPTSTGAVAGCGGCRVWPGLVTA